MSLSSFPLETKVRAGITKRVQKKPTLLDEPDVRQYWYADQVAVMLGVPREEVYRMASYFSVTDKNKGVRKKFNAQQINQLREIRDLSLWFRDRAILEIVNQKASSKVLAFMKSTLKKHDKANGYKWDFSKEGGNL